MAGGIAVVRSGVAYVGDGDEVLDIVLWRLGYRPDSAWSKKEKTGPFDREQGGNHPETNHVQTTRAFSLTFFRLFNRQHSGGKLGDGTVAPTHCNCWYTEKRSQENMDGKQFLT